MDIKNSNDPEVILLNWRTRILNVFLIIVTIAAAIMLVVTILDVLAHPSQWPAVVIYTVMLLVLVVLTVFRRIDYRIRAWGVLLVPYVVGVTTMATFGLGSSGRLYFLAVTIGALILIGVRPAIFTSVLSLITLAVFAYMAHNGMLQNWLISDRNSLLLSDWIAESSDTVGLLITMMALLVMFYRFQERLIASERKVQAELMGTHKLLEEQNSTLEQKIQERTSELKASNHSLEQRNAALAVINNVSQAMTQTLDIKTMTRLVGDKMLEIFNVDSALIMLLDTHTNLISIPYEYDKNEGGYIEYVEPFPLGTGLSSKVILSGQPLMAGTLEEEIANGAYFPPEIIAKGSGFFSQSWVGVPIISNDQVLGLVALADGKPHAFNQNHVRLLQTLASNMSAAIKNVHLFEAEQQRVTELQIINNIQQGLAAELDFQSVVDQVGDTLRKVFNTLDLYIAWYDSKANLMHYLYLYEHGQRLSVPSIPPLPGGKFETMQKTKQPIIFNTLADYETIHSTTIPGTDQSKSLVSVPIISGDRVLGTIQLENYERENAYGESELRLLTTIAGSLGGVLENARLFDETQRLLKETEQRATELQIINSIQAGLVLKLEFQAIIDMIGDKIRDIFDAQATLISLYNRETNEIDHRYMLERGHRFLIGKPVLIDKFRQRVVETRQTWLINQNYRQIAVEIGEETILEGEEPKSLLFAPMIVGDQVTGIISLQNMDHEGAFSESDVRLLSTIANSMSVVLENARLFDETQRLLKVTEDRAAELQIINSVQEGLASKLDIQAIYDLVGNKVNEIFDTTTVVLATFDHEKKMMYWQYVIEQGERYFLKPTPIPPITAEFIRLGQTRLINNDLEGYMRRIDPNFEESMPHAGEVPKSLLSVPLKTQGDVRGVIGLQNVERENAFSDSDVRLLETLANSMSVALENARLFDETQRLLKETEQRNAELAVINSIQQGLAAELDFQAIIDLIGDKLREVLHTDEIGIRWYDDKEKLVHYLYEIEHGKRLTIPPTPPQTTTWEVMTTRREPRVINTSEEMSKVGLLPGTEAGKSSVNVDIVGSDKVIGSIIIENYEKEYAFGESEIRLLTTVASSMGVALENARLFDETQRLLKETEQRNAELAVINSIQQGLAAELDFQAIVDLVGDKLSEVLNTGDLGIIWHDEKTNLVHYLYVYEKGERLSIPSMPPTPGGQFETMRKTRQPIVWNTLADMTAPLVPGTEQGKSLVTIPIISSDQVLGGITIENYERENAFGESEIRLLTTIAASLGTALENARLFDETQRLLNETEQRNRELATINNIQQGLASKLDLQDMIEMFGDELTRLYPPEERKAYNYSVFIAMYDPKTMTIQFPYLIDGEGNRFTEPATELGQGLTSIVIRSGQVLLLNTLEEQAAHGVITFTQKKVHVDSQSWLGVPIKSGDRVIGVVSMQDQRPNLFTESDVRLLTTLASNLGVAMENSRLFKETEQRAAELDTVNTVSSALISELDLNALIHLVGEQIRTIFKADIAYVALLDKTSSTINFPYTFGEELTPIKYGEGLTSKIIESNTPLLINQEWDRQMVEIGATRIGTQSRSYLGVPIIVGGKAVGVVSVQSTKEEGLFNKNDQHLLGTIAANVGIALQNARLFDEVKRHEVEVRESAEKLRLIFENAHDGIDIYEEIPSEGKRILLDCNDRYCEMAGRSREELMSVENTVVFQRPVAGTWEETGRESIIKGRAFSGVFSWIRPDGKENVIEYNAAPTKIGDRYFTIGLDRDITERTRVENELRESNEKLRLIFENAFDGISIYEEIPAENKRILVDCNERYCEIAGRSKEELLAIEDTRTIQRDLGVDAERFDFEPITAGRVFSGVFAWERPDGRENIIEYNAAPTRVGERFFTIGLDRDVTERRHAEEEIRKARAAAEQANQAKSAFLANMSHELRTPLNAIIGFTRIVRRKAEGVLAEKQTENLDKVLTSADHLLNLINTVLDIAKIEAGRMDVLAANFRISALIDLCFNTSQPLIKPKVVLEKQVDENLNIVYSDQDKIRQIVLNLLSNAAKFTHEGKIILAAKPDGENLCVSVSDTGIGISAEALPRIFKEFQQADNTTTRQYGGTGLGLSISRNLARLLGGDITVESELGKGSTFTLIIPLQYRVKSITPSDEEPRVSLDDEPAPAQEAVLSPEPSSAKKRILVIDDDPDAVYILQENINQQEYEITGRLNGKDGFQAARELHPHAILLDIVMPGTDGWQVLHDLKADPATSNIPVILHTIVDNKPLGFQLGAAAYLLKPLNAFEVRDTLNRVVGQGDKKQKHVLVVDDDPNVADMLRQVLPESDFDLESVQDGEACLRAIEARRPDILLLDLIMPRLDGFGVIKKLRTNPKTRDLPIIVISAKDLTSAESAKLKKTVSGVMKKQGFEGEKLVDEINNTLKQERMPS